MNTPLTLLVGHPRADSRTSAVAMDFVAALRTALADEHSPVDEPEVVDLATHGSDLPARSGSTVPVPDAVDEALATVRRPGLLVVASPTFKGAYSGLLKLFLDMLPMDGLADTVAVPFMTAGWDRHRGAGEQFLRPLLTELGATAPVPAVSIAEAEFTDIHPVLGAWLKTHTPTLAAVLRRYADQFEPMPTRDGSHPIPTGGRNR